MSEMVRFVVNWLLTPLIILVMGGWAWKEYKKLPKFRKKEESKQENMNPKCDGCGEKSKFHLCFKCYRG